MGCKIVALTPKVWSQWRKHQFKGHQFPLEALTVFRCKNGHTIFALGLYSSGKGVTSEELDMVFGLRRLT